MPREELTGVTTKVLLGRRDQLLRCEESLSHSDIDADDPILATEQIIFKDSDEWRAAYANIKAVLAEREHVPRGAQRRATKARAVRAKKRR